MDKDELMLLGKIDGKLDGITAHLTRQDQRMDALDQKMDGLDARLRTVEQKAAVAGAISGSAVSVGMALIIEGVKQWMAGGGLGR
jgi:hypothetical protein